MFLTWVCLSDYVHLHICHLEKTNYSHLSLDWQHLQFSLMACGNVKVRCGSQGHLDSFMYCCLGLFKVTVNGCLSNSQGCQRHVFPSKGGETQTYFCFSRNEIKENWCDKVQCSTVLHCKISCDPENYINDCWSRLSVCTFQMSGWITWLLGKSYPICFSLHFIFSCP